MEVAFGTNMAEVISGAVASRAISRHQKLHGNVIAPALLYTYQRWG
ncbi:MAG: hypothetical protein KJ871_04755 [Alphaproteobacteria bacterium]|nr:hypothetical protein [Alphaproteobacteria bacterium]MBU2083448.1 hypothetical protein [Alphaproteobacteria bacterium]MBU2143586.1 hypothetical protein [Alphaproteobacteria bacterium]MBU2196013.1 hypothetical protein [Alphaproteobacteria bacterium]